MNRTQFVKYIFDNNLKWRKEGAKLTPKGVQKLIETSYDQGVKHSNHLNNPKPQPKSPENPFKDFFPWT